MTHLSPVGLARVAEAGRAAGLARVGVVRLDHPGFAAAARAFDRFLADRWHGDMEFLARTRAVRVDPTRMLEGARSLVVTVVPYDGEAGPIARYARGRDYHAVVRERLRALERAIRDESPGVETVVCVDTRPLMERAAAVLAGLGFLGKHGGLIVPGIGSHVVIGSILSTALWTGDDADVDVDRACWNACGQCTLCMTACPTKALVAPGRPDPRRCIAYLTIEHRGSVPGELAAKLGERVAGCDVCQDVCPYNAGRARRARGSPHAWPDEPGGDHPVLDVEAIAGLGSAAYRSFVRGTALLRIPRRNLRRNALIAVGNRSGRLTERELGVLERAMNDSEPLVRDAARWAWHRRRAHHEP
jgi:epoxyqueuosine reductase